MKIPGKATISNRTSTMASQFARACAPYVIPTPDDYTARYRLLDMAAMTPSVSTICRFEPMAGHGRPSRQLR